MFVPYTALISFVIGGIIALQIVPQARLVSRVVGVYLFGLLFLPNGVELDLPIFPALDKPALSGLVPLVGVALRDSRRLTSRQLRSGSAWLMWVVIAGTLGTALTNPDQLVYGAKVQSALRPYDAVYDSVTFFATIVAPFWVARAVIRTPEEAEAMLKVTVVMGLIYLPICAVELVMSPQLHKWVYGYSVLAFRNVVRGEGFKPVGFTTGGLALAIFLYSAAVGAVVLARLGRRVVGLSAGISALAIWLVLTVSKNVGANIFAVVSWMLLRLGSWRLPLRMASVLMVCVFAYPWVRGLGVVDVYPVIDKISEYSTQRASSLRTRFVNEDEMFARAMQRPWFGWGGYGRNKIYNEEGVSRTLQDGYWIILLGTKGIVGMGATFLMLGLPVFGWRRKLLGSSREQRIAVGGIALLLSFRMIDLLPNALFSTEPAFLAGALCGLRDHLRLWGDSHPERASRSQVPPTDALAPRLGIGGRS